MNDVQDMAERALDAAKNAKLVRLVDNPNDIPREGFLVPAGLYIFEATDEEFKELSTALEHRPSTIDFVFGIVEEEHFVLQFFEYAEDQHQGMVRLNYWRDAWIALGMPKDELDIQFNTIIPLSPYDIAWSELV